MQQLRTVPAWPGDAPAPRILKLTTARFVTAAGRSLEQRGVLPDLLVGGIDRPVGLDAAAQGSRTAEAALVRSGAFFDFAGDWLGARPALVLRAAQLSGLFDQGAPPQQPGGETEVEDLLSAAFVDGSLFAEFVRWLGRHDEVWAASDTAFDAAQAQLSAEGGDLRTVHALQAARRSHHESLRRQLAEHRPEVVRRLKDSISARLLSDESRLQRALEPAALAHDPVLAAAFDLLREPRDAYARLLLAAPATTGPLRVKTPTPPPPPPGFDPDAECLPLQVCDNSEYVYVAPV